MNAKNDVNMKQGNVGKINMAEYGRLPLHKSIFH